MRSRLPVPLPLWWASLTLALLPPAWGAEHWTLAPTAPPSESATVDRPYRVVVVRGADPLIPAMIDTEQALQRALQLRVGRPVEVLAETLDTGRYDGKALEGPFLQLLERKYSTERVDLVIAIAGFSLEFVQTHRERLWPQAPVVFGAIPRERLERIPLSTRTTGIVPWLDPSGTLRLARRLQPSAERIVVVGGASHADKLRSARVIAAIRREAPDLALEILDTLPVADVLTRLEALTPDTIVIYTGIFRDGAGESYTPSLLVGRLSAASAAPMYAHYASYANRGTVGGHMNDFVAEGEALGARAADVLTGRLPPDAPPLESTISDCRVDGRELVRWGLDEDRLPPGCRIEFSAHGLLDRHRQAVVIGLTLIILQAAMIAALLYQRRRVQRAAAEAQLARSELAHAARMATVGELTAAIAHEINQPLGAVASNADAAEMLLQSDNPPLNRVREVLRDLRAANLRASDVVNRLRTLLLKRPARVEPVDMRQAAEMVVRLLRSEAVRRRVVLTFDAEEGPLPVLGDAVQLQQVVLNLVMNGMDALADAQGERHVSLSARAEGAEAVVRVSDNGPGILPDSLPRVFDSFYTTKPHGMGLGLSISRTIVQSHGGRIEATSDPSAGACFTVRLPMAQESLTAEPTSRLCPEGQ